MEKIQQAILDYETKADKLSDLFEGIDTAISERADRLRASIDAIEKEALSQLQSLRHGLLKKTSTIESRLCIHSNFTRSLPTRLQKATRTNPLHESNPTDVQLLGRIVHTLGHPMEERIPTSIRLRVRLPDKTLSIEEGQIGKGLVYGGFPSITRGVETLRESRRSACRTGKDEYGLGNAAGVAVHPVSGHIYIADNSNGRVLVLSKDLVHVCAIGSSGTDRGCFRSPTAVAVSADGERIAVADRDNRCVQIYDGQHRPVAVCVYTTTQAETFFGVCFDAEGFLYAAMVSGGAVKFTPDGVALFAFGTANSPHPVESTHGIMVDDDNDVYLLSRPGAHVHVFASDGSFRRSIPIDATQNNWNFLARAGADCFAVSDCSGNAVSFYGADGRKVHSLSMTLPAGVAFGLDGAFYVVSCRHNSIFEY